MTRPHTDRTVTLARHSLLMLSAWQRLLAVAFILGLLWGAVTWALQA